MSYSYFIIIVIKLTCLITLILLREVRMHKRWLGLKGLTYIYIYYSEGSKKNLYIHFFLFTFFIIFIFTLSIIHLCKRVKTNLSNISDEQTHDENEYGLNMSPDPNLIEQSRSFYTNTVNHLSEKISMHKCYELLNDIVLSKSAGIKMTHQFRHVNQKALMVYLYLYCKYQLCLMEDKVGYCMIFNFISSFACIIKLLSLNPFGGLKNLADVHESLVNPFGSYRDLLV